MRHIFLDRDDFWLQLARIKLTDNLEHLSKLNRRTIAEALYKIRKMYPGDLTAYCAIDEYINCHGFTRILSNWSDNSIFRSLLMEDLAVLAVCKSFFDHIKDQLTPRDVKNIYYGLLDRMDTITRSNRCAIYYIEKLLPYTPVNIMKEYLEKAKTREIWLLRPSELLKIYSPYLSPEVIATYAAER